ncbi:MAG: hypothetical protein DCC71_17905 [Proteobacteria bacterium]|nr:MAG: hypothetical protein DCC71_17905 [Pseudomonadota bacterium]
MAALLAAWGAILSKYGVDVPFGDQWDSPVRQLASLRAGDLTLAELTYQHNEGRKLFPNLISLGVAMLAGHYDTRAELIVGPAVFAATLAALLVATRRAASRATCATIAAVATGIAWSPRTAWFHQYSITFERLLPELTLACALSLLVLRGGGWTATLGAIALAGVGQFSFPSGIVAWPLLIGFVLLARRANARVAAAALAGGALAVSALYFHGYVQPPHHSAPSAVLAEPPGRIAGFALAFLGNAFTQARTGVWIGALGLLAWIALAARALRGPPGRERDVRLLWTVYGAFSVALAALTTITRLPMGAAHAARHDYVSQAMPLYVSIAALVLLDVAPKRRHAVHALAIAASVAWASSLASDGFRRELEQRRQDRLRIKACIVLARHHDDDACLRAAYPFAPIGARIDAAAPFLQPPLQDALRLGSAGVGSVDAVEPDGDAFLLAGWAARDGAPADAVAIAADDLARRPARILAIARVGEPRPDLGGAPQGWRARVGVQDGLDPCRLRVYAVDTTTALLHPLASVATRCRTTPAALPPEAVRSPSVFDILVGTPARPGPSSPLWR